MAYLQMSILSQSLMRTVPVNVILPVDKLVFPGMPPREEKPYKTLYLLHGVFGSHIDWINGTNIQRWAEENNLAVIMPAGENMFYVDLEASHNYYGEFIGRELVDMTRKMFPLSRKREDTYIAGLSMGGYGALSNGLKYHETFGCIAGLSAAAIIDDIDKRTDDVPVFIESRQYLESIFGDLSKVEDSDKNPKWLARKLAAGNAVLPKIYLACGLQDFLLSKNQDLQNYLKELGYDVTYDEMPGGHDWDFWNCQIKKVLDWLPLEGRQAGISSGNVGI